jgi:hypothetical protein
VWVYRNFKKVIGPGNLVQFFRPKKFFGRGVTADSLGNIPKQAYAQELVCRGFARSCLYFNAVPV